MAEQALIQRFENTMNHRNFPGPGRTDARGMLFPDHTDDKKLVLLLRKMRRYNPVPNQAPYGPGSRNLQLRRIVEDPSFRDSAHSYFVQAADLAAFLLYQYLAPKAYIRKKSAQIYFLKIHPVLCTQASVSDPYGIVRL